MTEDPCRDFADHIARLLDQAADGSVDPVARISATIAVGPYLESLTRHLVEEARDGGASWADLAEVFRTSEANVRHRYGSLSRFDDDGG